MVQYKAVVLMLLIFTLLLTIDFRFAGVHFLMHLLAFLGGQMPDVMVYMVKGSGGGVGGGSTDYTCKLCGYKTIYHSTAKRHMIRKHAQHYVVHCQYCHKACRHEEALKTHLRTCLKNQKFPYMSSQQQESQFGNF